MTPIGRGGMAEVWAAEHVDLGTRHALKILRSPLPGLRERFLREGRLQARLDPAHVVPVTDVLDLRGAPTLVMPLVEGCSLAELLEDHRPDEAEAIALVAGILEGVGAAHAAGIVHRDLKPGNVLLEARRGRIVPRVADFGIAKDREVSVVSTVAFLGTPAYAAPEQLHDASAVDARADLWSVGVILYELLAGRRPFEGSSVEHVLYAVQREAVDLEPLPERWRGIVATLLEPDPGRRPASAAAVRALLGEVPDALRLGTALAETVRRRAVRFTQGAPQGTRPQAPSFQLPDEPDAFVGRARDLRDLAEALHRGRLVTVLGIGGSGKTRLALRYGHQHRHEWAGGVWFCDLSAARTRDAVLHAIARVLDVPLSDEDPAARLGHALSGRGRALLVLDNAEQVSDAVAALLSRWLDQAPGAAFVVTSRRRVGLTAEHPLDLQPLEHDEAVELFVVRAARARQGGFQPSEDDREAIGDLVALLDGLPLALELAAARVRTIGPRRLLERMSDRFRVLASRGTDRQATLRATLDDSWDLLDADERACLAQLSVFRGGFDLEAAEAVVVLDDAWVLDAVEALVDHSLVRVVGRDRFTLLMSVQQYAAEQLGDEARHGAEERHGRFFAQLGAPEALQALDRHGGLQLRRALAADLDNLVAAGQRSERAVAAACALAAWPVLQVQGPLELALQLLEAVDDPRVAIARAQALHLSGRVAEALSLAESSGAEALRLRAECLHDLGRVDEARAAYAAALDAGDTYGVRRLGNLHREQGRRDDARTCYDAALAHAIEVGDRRQELLTRCDLAALEVDLGRLDAAVEGFRRALDVARASSDRAGQAMALVGLGSAHHDRGDTEQAQDHYEQSLALLRKIGARRNEAMVLGNLGGLFQELGRYAEALQVTEEALAIVREQRNRYSEGILLGNLAIVYGRLGELELAQQSDQQALEVHREIGNRTSEGVSLANLAARAARLGRLREAEEQYAAALGLFRELKLPRDEAIVRGNLVELLIDLGLHEQALAHADTAVAVLQEIGDRRFEGSVLESRGRVLRWLGRRAEARQSLEASASASEEAANRPEQARAACELAALDLDEGDAGGAEARLAKAQALVRDIPDPALQGVVLLARAEHHQRRGQAAQALALLAEAEPLLAGARKHLARAWIVRALVERDPAHLERAAEGIDALGLGEGSPLGLSLARARSELVQ